MSLKQQRGVLAGALLLLVIASLILISTANGVQHSSATPPSYTRTQPTAPREALAMSGESGAAGRTSVPDTSSNEPLAPLSSTTSVAPHAFGTIVGVVVDQFSRSVPGGIADLYTSSGVLQSATVRADGGFELRAPPGQFQVQLREDSLPRGYLTPWRQSQGAKVYKDDPNFANGFFATEVNIPSDGGKFQVELRVFQEAIVAGYVIGPGGEPVDGAVVRIQSCLATVPTGLESTATTDFSGRYEMFGVYPSKYRTEVWLNATTVADYHTMRPPLPQKVEVIEGGIYEVPALQVGGGNKVILGTVVNQDGQPFEGLTVLCYLALSVEQDEIPFNWSSELVRTTTDSSGRFELHELPEAAVKVQVAADFEPGKPLGERRAAFWVNPIEIDLSNAPEVTELPKQQVDQSRPFFFTGTIELDSSWASENRVTLDKLDVEVDLANPGEELPDAPRRPSFRKERLHVDRNGIFQWACETPHLPVRITVHVKKTGAQSVDFVLYPEPNRTEPRTIHFPNS